MTFPKLIFDNETNIQEEAEIRRNGKSIKLVRERRKETNQDERERNVDNLEKSVPLPVAHFSVIQEQLYHLLRVA